MCAEELQIACRKKPLLALPKKSGRGVNALGRVEKAAPPARQRETLEARVERVSHDGRFVARKLDDTELIAIVSLDRAVPIDVLRIEIEEHDEIGSKHRVRELIARKLEHPVVHRRGV